MSLRPDNTGAGQLNQGQIIGGFFLKTNEQFAKAVEKRVCDRNDFFQTVGFSKNPAANHFGNVQCTVLPLPYSRGNAFH
jgi:hypothetical protein